MSGGVEGFLADVRVEIVRARTKFPGDNLTTIALMEEVGEVAKAVLDETPERVRKEAVQVACMAARLVLDGDSSTTAYRAARSGQLPLTGSSPAAQAVAPSELAAHFGTHLEQLLDLHRDDDDDEQFYSAVTTVARIDNDPSRLVITLEDGRRLRMTLDEQAQ